MILQHYLNDGYLNNKNLPLKSFDHSRDNTPLPKNDAKKFARSLRMTTPGDDIHKTYYGNLRITLRLGNIALDALLTRSPYTTNDRKKFVSSFVNT
jgi:hypothetical protein